MKKENVDRFNADIEKEGGYQYTGDAYLSAQMANQRMSDSVRSKMDWQDLRVLDIGCGDGTYTRELAGWGCCQVLGVDAAKNAIAKANLTFISCENLNFEVVDIYSLEPPEVIYDVAVVRGLLHHLLDQAKAIQIISKMAKVIIVVEPNGANPVLKVIEKLSAYHREHEEQSFLPSTLDGWFQQSGGKVVEREFIGLVPHFWPEKVAKLLKWVEPIIEKIPLVRRIFCGQYVQKIVML